MSEHLASWSRIAQVSAHTKDLSFRQFDIVSETRKKTSFPGFDVSGFLAACGASLDSGTEKDCVIHRDRS
jgi:hypothetical protein